MRSRNIVAVFLAIAVSVLASSPSFASSSLPHEPTGVGNAKLANDLTIDEEVNAADPYGTKERPRILADPPSSLRSCKYHVRDLVGGRSLRTELGLPKSLGALDSYTEVRYGIRVSPGEAAFLDEGMRVRSSIDTVALDQLLRSKPDSLYLESAWSAEDHKLLVFVRASKDGSALSSLSAEISKIASPEDLVITQTDTEFSIDQLLSMKSSIAIAFAKRNPSSSLDLSLDESCGKILAIVENQADAELIERTSTELAIPQELVVSVVAPESGFRAVDRYDYHTQRGGLSYQIRNPSTGVALQCTSSIPFKDVNGTRYAIAAAHCMPYPTPSPHFSTFPAADWYQGTLAGGTDINLWTGSHYVMGGQLDVAVTAMIPSATVDSSSMIHGGNHSVVAMGWWQWSPSMSKKDDPVCHSGINWAGAVCGTISNPYWTGTAFNVQFDGLMKSTMTAYEGDSGGTIWSDRSDGRWYVGVMSAANTGNTLFTHIGYMKGKFTYLQAPVNMS